MADDLAARSPGWHATTILMVRKGGKVVIGGDGQVSMGQTVVKSNARKVRRLAKGDVIAGFAGAEPSRTRAHPGDDRIRRGREMGLARPPAGQRVPHCRH